jgi:hypothetical protein
MPWLATQGTLLGPLLFVWGFAWLSLALGRRALSLFAVGGAITRAERAVLSAALGAGALQFLPFAMGVATMMDPRSLRIATALVCLAAAPDLWAVLLDVRAAWRERRAPRAWTIAWIVALSPALIVAGLTALTPSHDADGLAYHLTVPKRWMHAGSLEYLPTYPYSNAPMGASMLFALAMAFAGDVAAKCVHFALGVLATYAVFLSGRRLANAWVGAASAAFFLVGPLAVVNLLGFAYVEGAASCAISASVLAWAAWLQTSDRGLLRCAAVLSGLAVSFKISAAVFPVALLALTAIALFDKHRSGQLSGGVLSIAGSHLELPALAALPMLPWIARSLLMTGNPVFPLFASIIPSRDLSAHLAAQMDRYNRTMLWGNSLGRQWTEQHRSLVLLAVAGLLLALCSLVALRVRSRLARGTVAVAAFIALVQLGAAGLYLRYWVPIGAALAIPIALAGARLLARHRVRLALLAVALLSSLFQARRGLADEGGALQLARAVTGVEARQDYLRERLPLFSLYEIVNRDLRPDAGVMLSAYCGGFYIDRKTFCAEMVQNSLRFTSWQEFTEDIRRLGITHVIAPSVLASGGELPVMAGASVGVITQRQQFRLVRELLTHHARLLATASDQGLFALEPSATAGSHVSRLR